MAGAQIIEGGVEVVFVEGAQTQHFCDGLIGGPAHGREPRSLVGQARQHQEQGEFGGPRSTQRGGQAQLIGELLERQEQAKDGAADGSGGKLIELAAEGAPEGPRRGRGASRRGWRGCVF